MECRLLTSEPDNTVRVLENMDLPLKDRADVAALDDSLQDKAYQQCGQLFCFCIMQEKCCLCDWLPVHIYQ